MSEVNFSAAINAARLINETSVALAAREKKLQHQRRSLEERNSLLVKLPLQPEEVKAFMLKSIDLMAAEYIDRSNWRGMFSTYAFPNGGRSLPGCKPAGWPQITKHDGALNLADLDAIKSVGTLSAMLGLHATNFFLGDVSSDPAHSQAVQDGRVRALEACRMAFFFGDILKAKIERHFDQLFPDTIPGRSREKHELTIDQRRAEIGANEVKLSEVEAELEKVNAQLAELTNAKKETP